MHAHSAFLVVAAASSCIEAPIFLEATGGAGGEGLSSSTSGSSASSSASASASATTSASSSSGSAGGGGGAGCSAPLMPSLPPCGGLQDDFESAAVFGANWTLQSGTFGGGLVQLQAGSEMGTMVAGFLDTIADFTFTDCQLGFEVVEVDSGLACFLNVNSAGGNLGWRINTFDQTLSYYINDGSKTVIDSFAYDPVAARFLALRAAGDQVGFARSPDGICWDVTGTTAKPAFADVVGLRFAAFRNDAGLATATLGGANVP